MKRKIFVLAAIILTLSLALTACVQKNISEAEAKEVGLVFIDRIFDVGETEATVQRYVDECYPGDDGAVFTGDANIGTRVVYDILVANNDSQPLYDVWVAAASGKVYYVRQGEINIIMTDAQKDKANPLFVEEKTWGEEHEAALNELKVACVKWVNEKLMGNSSVLIVKEVSDYPHEGRTITTTFTDDFYIVLRNGTIYEIAMQWPSMQVLSLSIINDPN